MAYTTINKSTSYFDTKLYVGGNGSATTISGLGFAPDFIWAKSRDDSGVHALMDRLRSGGYGHGWVRSESSDAENNNSGRGNISSFTSDGYVLSADTWGASNEGTTNHVAWNWIAGGAGSSNSNGSITSTVSANTTSGFSIVTYTGTGSNATVGHGLGVVPKMIMVKCRSESQDWFVYHNGIGTNALRLNGTGASEGGVWNSTAPTSSVFSIGTAQAVNKSSGTYVAYCFAEKPGYSKIGSYTGNGNADGTFVYTGFKPTFVLTKGNSAGENWFIHDGTRNTHNPTNKYIRPNLSNAEGSYDHLDLLSNGFKSISAGSTNGNNVQQIYMAFGQTLVGSNNIPCTAR